MTNEQQEFVDLTDRLSSLKERWAVVKAREEEKQKERERLLEELRILGVDTNNLDGEEKRLESEIQEWLKKAKQSVDTFEQQLNAVEGK